MDYKFINGCSKSFETHHAVYELSTNGFRTLTSQSALKCGDKFDGGKGVKLYLCDACKREAEREGYVW
jgi:hypothetical protein